MVSGIFLFPNSLVLQPLSTLLGPACGQEGLGDFFRTTPWVCSGPVLYASLSHTSLPSHTGFAGKLLMVGVQVFSFLRLPNFSSGFSDLLSLEPDWRWRETHKAASAFLHLLILYSVPSWQSFIWGRGRSVGRNTLLGLQYIVDGAKLMIQSWWYRVSDGTHISMSFLS